MSSSEWYAEEAQKLLVKYRNCSTMYEKGKLIPMLDEMIGKIQFQLRELKKYLPDENL